MVLKKSPIVLNIFIILFLAIFVFVTIYVYGQESDTSTKNTTNGGNESGQMIIFSNEVDLGIIISIVAFVVALYFNTRQISHNTKSKYSETMRAYRTELDINEKELNEVEKSLKSKSPKTDDQSKYDTLLTKYLGLLNEVAYLALKGFIHKKIAEFFNPSFEVAFQRYSLIKKEEDKPKVPQFIQWINEPQFIRWKNEQKLLSSSNSK